jgi:hypothetical protein
MLDTYLHLKKTAIINVVTSHTQKKGLEISKSKGNCSRFLLVLPKGSKLANLYADIESSTVNPIIKMTNKPSMVDHTCNPSYSGGRDEGDCSSKSAWANSSKDPIWKKPITNKGLVEWLKV